MTIPERRLRELTTVGRDLTRASSLGQVCALGMRGARDVLRARTAALFVRDPAGRFILQGGHGLDAGMAPVAADTAELERLVHERLPADVLLLPLATEAQTFGVLAVSLGEAGEPESGWPRWLASALADHLAVALESTHEDQATRRQLSRELEKSRAEADAHHLALKELSHDIRSPLNGIRMQLELLETGILGELTERQRDALRQIHTGIDRVARLALTVLESGRILAGDLELSHERVELVPLVRESVDWLAPQIREKGQTVELDAGDGLAVHADPERVRQIVVNLLDNAVKYSPDGERITVRCRPGPPGERYATVEMSDSGPGVPEGAREAIFEPYVRAGNAKDKASGTGLGLPIARELARLMGGEITVADSGTGARFTLRLPLAGAPAEDAGRAQSGDS